MNHRFAMAGNSNADEKKQEKQVKDHHTVIKEPARMGQWVKMALELAEEYAS